MIWFLLIRLSILIIFLRCGRPRKEVLEIMEALISFHGKLPGEGSKVIYVQWLYGEKRLYIC